MNNLEIYFKAIELLLTFGRVTLVLFGLIIPYRQSIKLQNKNRLDEIEFQKKSGKKS